MAFLTLIFLSNAKISKFIFKISIFTITNFILNMSMIVITARKTLFEGSSETGFTRAVAVDYARLLLLLLFIADFTVACTIG